MRNHYVYRAYDAKGLLLYVGCTNNPARRQRQHKSTSYWYRHFDRAVLVGPFNQRTAYEVEAQQIRELRPYFNGLSVKLADPTLRGYVDFLYWCLTSGGLNRCSDAYAGEPVPDIGLGRVVEYLDRWRTA